MKNNKLVIISSNFPFGNSETFLENEMKILSNKFDEIIIFPLNKEKEIRIVPENIKINNALNEHVLTNSKKTSLLNILLIFKILSLEFIHTNKKKYFITRIKLFIDTIAKNIQKSNVLFEELKKNHYNKSIFYSYWMNDGALILSILKSRNRIKDFIFRVHGYDLYNERQEGGYMPFRYINMKYCKTVFAVSETGQKYLKYKNIFPEKIKISKLGTVDSGSNSKTINDKFVIVTCSSLISLKRVDLIPEILNNVNFPVKWIHFGSGDEKNKVLKKIEDLKNNIEIVLKGSVENKEILNFYLENSINLFVNLSTTEGLPVSIMEAISFGIPIIATSTGGTPEIVNEKTGILIPVDFDIKKVAEIINTFPESKYNTLEFRKGVREFWKENFDAEKNYVDFYRKITQGI